MGYFLAIVALMLYLSMVLHRPPALARRSRGTQPMAGHYAVRFLALVAVVIALNVFLVAPRSAARRRHQRTAQLAVAADPRAARTISTPSARS